MNKSPQHNREQPVQKTDSIEDAWWEETNLENFLQELSIEKNVFAARGNFFSSRN